MIKVCRENAYLGIIFQSIQQLVSVFYFVMVIVQRELDCAGLIQPGKGATVFALDPYRMSD